MDMSVTHSCTDGSLNDHASNITTSHSCRTERDNTDQPCELMQRATSRGNDSTPSYRRSGINNCSFGNQPRRSLKSLLLSCQKNKGESFHYTRQQSIEDGADSNEGKMALKRSSSVPNRILFPLHDAVRNNDVKEMVKLFKKKKRIDVDVKDDDGFSPLHRAAQTGNTEAVQVLLVHGASVNLPSKTSMTPLYYAVQSGNFECASLLIENGADQSDIKDGFTDNKNQDSKANQKFSRTRMSLHN